MAVSGEDLLNVAWHGHVTHAFGIVPFKVHDGKVVTLPFLSDGVVLLEDVVGVKGVTFSHVFNYKFISNEGEYNRLPLVKP